MVVYGAQTPGKQKSISSNTIMVENGVYRLEYRTSGLRQLLPGWENEAVQSIMSEITLNYPGAIIQYINVEPNGRAIAEWRWLPLSVSTVIARDPGRASPMAFPVVPVAIYAIVTILSAAVLIWMISCTLEKVVQIVQEGGTEIIGLGNNITMVAGLVVVAVLFHQLSGAFGRGRSSGKASKA